MPDNIPDTLSPEAFQGTQSTQSVGVPDTIPADQFVSQDDALQERYGTVPQTALAAAEGAGQSLLGPGAPALEIESGLTTGKDIQNRAAASPIAHGVGQAAGLVGGAISGDGLPAIMEELGAGAAATTGLGGIPAAAVRSGIENAVFQGSDELSKMVYGDPDTTAQSAIANVGLSSLIGAGAGGLLGAASPLWEAAAGTKVGQYLSALKNKAAGESVTNDVVNDSINKLGISVPPEVRAALSDDPSLHEAFTTLANSDTTKSGQALQTTLKDFNKSVGDNIVQSMGYTADSLPENISKYEAGKNLGNTLADEFDTTVKPLSNTFDSLKDKYASVPLEQTVKDSIADDIGKLADKERWTLSPSSEIMQKIHGITKDIPNLSTLGDISSYMSRIGESMQSDPLNGPLRRAGSLVKSVFRDAEGNTAIAHLGQDAPELVEQYKAARSAWGEASKLRDALDERLGTKVSTGRFAKSLRELANTDGESVLRKLSGTNDANLLELLSNQFPQTASALKKYHVDNLLESAASKANPNETISVARLASQANKMSPEMQSFAIPSEVKAKIDASSNILKKLNSLPQNHSGTARTLDKLFSNLPGTAVGLAAGLVSHSPYVGIAAGKLASLLAKDAPDAIRLGMLKAVGDTGIEANASHFKSMVDYIDYAQKGQKALESGVKSVFKIIPVASVAAPSISDAKAKSLDKKIQAFTAKNELPSDSAYLPEHASSLNNLATNVVQYLFQQRPTSVHTGPLDTPIQSSTAQKMAYRRTLTLAESPLSILDHIKRGNLLPSDVQAVNTMYPALAQSIRQNMSNEMVKSQAKGQLIPYNTKAGLSMFMGEALDSTMSQSSIQTAQAALAPSVTQAPQGVSTNKKSTSSLSKLSETYSTPLQARASSKVRQD